MGKPDARSCALLRQAMALAGIMGHSRVDTAHLLLAVSICPEEAARGLARQLLTPGELMWRMLEESGRGSRLSVLPDSFSPSARQALREAGWPPRASLLLCALLRQENTQARRLLAACAVSTQTLLCEVREGQQTRKEPMMQNVRLLEQFGTDLVERSEKLGAVIGREREITAVLRILSRRQKNNPALIGEPGVGKTAIVEGVAQRIASGQVPEALRGKRLFSLDMASVIAGTKYRGEFEERIRDLLAEVRRAQNIILFLDEMHTLVGAGAAEGAIDAANLLKPALGRGEVQLIGATTLTEYRKHIEKDAALERRFCTVPVAEATPEETKEILEALRPKLEAHHRLRITGEAINAAVELSCRYLTDKFLPDKAVDLLDEGAAGAAMRHFAGAAPENGLEEALHQAVRQGNFERAAGLRDRLMQKKGRSEKPAAEERDVAAVVSARTGIPVGAVSMTEKERLSGLEQKLSERVKGQPEAIAAVAGAVRRGRSGLAEEQRPVAAMLFTGPTGVGKTELCKALAEAVYGSEQAMIRVDMSEYMEKFSVSRLIGAPPGYVGHEEGGQLSERVRRRPYSLVLLDELEKAHVEVCGLLLQILEDGILTDSEGRRVDFRNTLLIMTSNLGSQWAGKGALGFGSTPEDLTMQALRAHFPPELLGRMDCIATFRPLSQQTLRDIAAQQLSRLRSRAARQQLALSWEPQVESYLAQRCAGKSSGARALRSLLRQELEAPLAASLLSRDRPGQVRLSVVDQRLCMS